MMTYAGNQAGSFAQASEALGELARLSISAERIRRACHHVGYDLIEEQRRLEEAYLAKRLFEQATGKPADVSAPEIACVMVDGGRYQRLDRPPGAQARDRKKCGAKKPRSARKGKHWKESRIALLAKLTGSTHDVDPQPQLPQSLRYSAAAEKLAEIGKTGRKQGDSEEHSADESEDSADDLGTFDGLGPREPAMETIAHTRFTCASAPTINPLSPAHETSAAGSLAHDVGGCEVDPHGVLRPKLEQRAVIASRCDWNEFGSLVASQAWYRGFAAATRKVFVSDGSATIEKLQREHFSRFVSVLDLLHALSYALAAARAVSVNEAAAEQQYDVWAALIWRGHVAEVIAELAAHENRLGTPPPDAGDNDPREVVRRSHGFFTNHQSRMDYPSYRRQGFPLTSSLIESTVKQVSRRVKGTEKFWSSTGAEAMLRLRGESLSDERPLDRYFTLRSRQASATRAYRQRNAAVNK